jgi:hypothetical protein
MGRPKKVVNKGGRPEKIKELELQKLETAFKMGCNNSEACSYAEIPESTFYEYLKKNPMFSDKIVGWKRNPILKAKHTIYKNLDDAKTAQWYLERKCKEEFSTQSKLELESKGINIVVADDEHKQMLEDL